MEDWLPHHRGFHKECPKCEGTFIGRKNKIYCSDACKNLVNNELAAEKRLKERDLVGAIIKNERILESVMFECEIGQELTVPVWELTEKGFDSTAPMKRSNREGQLWFVIGSYRFYKQSNDYVRILKQ